MGLQAWNYDKTYGSIQEYAMVRFDSLLASSLRDIDFSRDKPLRPRILLHMLCMKANLSLCPIGLPHVYKDRRFHRFNLLPHHLSRQSDDSVTLSAHIHREQTLPIHHLRRPSYPSNHPSPHFDHLSLFHPTPPLPVDNICYRRGICCTLYAEIRFLSLDDFHRCFDNHS